MAIPPPNFNRPQAPVPGAIPRPGAVPPATQALPTVATSTSALHPVTTAPLNSQRAANTQPDAAQEFVMQFKKTLLPYLVQALDPKLLERGNEGALKKRIEELVDEQMCIRDRSTSRSRPRWARRSSRANIPSRKRSSSITSSASPT